MKLYVVFPVHNGLESTITFLRSLERQTFPNFEVVICDDGSTDGTSKYLAENFPKAVVLKGTGSLWWTGGINLCLKYVLANCDPDDYVLTINCDVTIDMDYLERKVRTAARFPKAVVGSVCVDMADSGFIETSGSVVDFDKCVLRPITSWGERRTDKHAGVVEVHSMPGKGVMLPVEVFQTIGLYDDTRLPHYHADSDFVLSAYEAGYQVLIDFDSVVYSDVNLRNVGIVSEEMTIKSILKTFQGRYSINNYSILTNFGKKHFGTKWKTYVAKAYIKIIGGTMKRYFQYKLRKLFRVKGRYY